LQLERVGYFVVDYEDSRPGALVLNRIVTLRDSWTGRAANAPHTDTAAPSAKSKTSRPPKKSGTEYRSEARSRDPVLAERFVQWPDVYGLSQADVDLLTGDRPTGDLFAEAVAGGAPATAVARWIINELPRELGDRQLTQIPMTGVQLGSLVEVVESGTIAGPAAKEVFAELMRHGGDPQQIISARGLAQVSDEAAIAAIVDEVLASNPDKVATYRGGKSALLGFFVGQVVKASKGKANPQVAQKLLTKQLG
jgi:glutaminyl-tRNA synthetase